MFPQGSFRTHLLVRPFSSNQMAALNPPLLIEIPEPQAVYIPLSLLSSWLAACLCSFLPGPFFSHLPPLFSVTLPLVLGPAGRSPVRLPFVYLSCPLLPLLHTHWFSHLLHFTYSLGIFPLTPCSSLGSISLSPFSSLPHASSFQ